MDYTNILERIAVANEAAVNGNSYYFTVGAILISALIGFFASNRIYKKQQDSEKENKLETIKMIIFLLNQEISQRWFKDIEPQLGSVFKRDSDIAILHGYQSLELNSGDFFTIKKVSENFQNFYYIENQLIKEIINSYIYLKDYNDIAQGAQKLYYEIESHKKTLSNNDYAGNIDDEIDKKFGEKIKHYNKIFKESIDKIDRSFREITKDSK